MAFSGFKAEAADGSASQSPKVLCDLLLHPLRSSQVPSFGTKPPSAVLPLFSV